MFARWAAATACGTSALALSARSALCEEEKPNKSASQSFFDADALERGAKAVREIDRSTNAKAVYEHLKQQELTKQADLKKDESANRAQMAQFETQQEQIRQQEETKRAQERAQMQRELQQSQAQLEQQKQQEQGEIQRRNNAEYLQQQKEVSLQVEGEKLKIARQIEAERQQSAKFEAEQAKAVAVEKALAEGRARAQEHRENRDIFMEEISESAKEWGKQYLALLQELMTNASTGAKLLLTTDYGPKAVYGIAAILGAYYGIRGGVGLTYRQLERFLNTPSLVRETSRYNMLQRARAAIGLGTSGTTPVARDAALAAADKTFSDVILAPDVKDSIRALAASAANTRLHGAPFRHYLLHGPPGTGKTLVAKRLAHTSGLDYAILSGGDVAPLGAAAVREIHSAFDWARRSRKGMVLFVDEADAFLGHRGAGGRSEGLRAAINAMLYRTGDQSADCMVIMATNRPEDLDRAVLDRMDEQLAVDLPDTPLREQLLHLYFARYVRDAAESAVAGLSLRARVARRMRSLLSGARATADNIDVAGFDAEMALRQAAQATGGFSGRELAKLMASVQAACYGTPDAKLTQELFDKVVASKLDQHRMRIRLESGNAELAPNTPVTGGTTA